MSAAKKASKKQDKFLRVTLTRSPIGYPFKQKRTVQALGLRKINQSVEQKDTPIIRGMIAKVEHLVTVEEIE
jgi:large subunit ribosomal protein L30